MISDFKYAVRTLGKTPGFTIIAVFTLALAIGANTAIFSLINDLFLRGLSFKEPRRVVHFFSNMPDGKLVDLPLSLPRFQHYRAGQTICDDLAAENAFAFTLTGLGDAVQLFGGRVTSNYFDMLGMRPTRGRNFLPNEEEGADVAMVTENFWQKRLGGDPNVVGRSITLDGTPHTIVGVLPNLPFAWVGPNAEVWTTKPYVIPGFTYERMMRGTTFLRVVGRLKPGMAVEQARAALPALDKSYRGEFPGKIDSGLTTTLKTIPEDVSGNLRPAFATLFAAVAFVLLIACSNVANLLLVRFSGRRREIALRMAIGASRTGIVRLFVFESLLVSLLAGIVGAVLAWQLVPLVPKMAANFLPFDPNTRVNLSFPVLGFTVALSILTGLLMGIYPALQSSHSDLVDALKEGGRGVSGSVRQQRFRKILVGAQVALSVTLLAGAALLIASFVRLNQQNVGYHYRNVWVGFVTLPTAQYSDIGTRQRFVERLLGSLRAIPGFESVTVSGDIPLLVGGGNATLYSRADGEVLPVDKRATAPSHDVSPGYFKTWGVPVLAGRDFDEHDTANNQNIVLISQSGAKKVFGNENPIGKTLLVTSPGTPCEIVGIVGDVRSRKVNEADDMEFYRPWAQENFPFPTIVVRSNLRENAVTKLVRSTLATVDPGLAIALPQSMDKIIAQALGQTRLMTWLLGIFAGVALLLAAIGIYAAVAYTVDQRTGEIGVRMALGAQTRDVLRMVVNQGMKPVFIGLAIGIASAFVLGRLITSQLYEVSANNPALLAGSTALLAAIALIACLIPARRATYVDPIQALRAE